jgi:hypothetical protein
MWKFREGVAVLAVSLVTKHQYRDEREWAPLPA